MRQGVRSSSSPPYSFFVPDPGNERVTTCPSVIERNDASGPLAKRWMLAGAAGSVVVGCRLSDPPPPARTRGLPRCSSRSGAHREAPILGADTHRAADCTGPCPRRIDRSVLLRADVCWRSASYLVAPATPMAAGPLRRPSPSGSRPALPGRRDPATVDSGVDERRGAAVPTGR